MQMVSKNVLYSGEEDAETLKLDLQVNVVLEVSYYQSMSKIAIKRILMESN